MAESENPEFTSSPNIPRHLLPVLQLTANTLKPLVIYRQGGEGTSEARRSDPTMDTNSPGDLHWEDQSPQRLALNSSGA